MGFVLPLTGSRRPHVVVIGAGFGGLAVADRLSREPVDVTLVDRHNFHTFLPLLYQVATSGLNAADVAPAVRSIFQRQRSIDFRHGTVTGVDWDRRRVLVDGQEPLSFDRLVVATGSRANFFGVPGAEEFAFPLYSLAEATALRNRILGAFEEADRAGGDVPDGALRFVVVGGGPTGVETAGALAELFGAVLRRDYRHADIRRAEVVLVETGPELLAPFSDSSRDHARRALRARGVEVRTGTTVSEVRDGSVVLEGGEVLPCQTLIWAAGVQAGSLVEALDVPTGAGGRIEVDDRLRIPGRPGAYAIGDVADLRIGERRLPQLAPVAIQTGTYVAAAIAAQVEAGVSFDGSGPTDAGDQSGRPFRYRDKGTMATIGRRSAVAEVPGLRPLTGSLAWVAWLALHLYFLIGFRNRVSVLVNWAWNYLTWDRGPRLIFGGGDRR